MIKMGVKGNPIKIKELFSLSTCELRFQKDTGYRCGANSLG